MKSLININQNYITHNSISIKNLGLYTLSLTLLSSTSCTKSFYITWYLFSFFLTYFQHINKLVKPSKNTGSSFSISLKELPRDVEIKLKSVRYLYIIKELLYFLSCNLREKTKLKNYSIGLTFFFISWSSRGINFTRIALHKQKRHLMYIYLFIYLFTSLKKNVMRSLCFLLIFGNCIFMINT